jgi:hypothetical protein
MNRLIFALFFYYASFVWHEFERMLKIIIIAQISKGRISYVFPIYLWERRCNRRFVRRGKYLDMA